MKLEFGCNAILVGCNRVLIVCHNTPAVGDRDSQFQDFLFPLLQFRMLSLQQRCLRGFVVVGDSVRVRRVGMSCLRRSKGISKV